VKKRKSNGGLGGWMGSGGLRVSYGCGGGNTLLTEGRFTESTGKLFLSRRICFLSRNGILSKE